MDWGPYRLREGAPTVFWGLVTALVMAAAGVLWRFAWSAPEDRPAIEPVHRQASRGGATAPIAIKLLDGGGVEVNWSIVDHPELHGYALDVTAVRPVEFTYSVPRYPGDPDVTERLYPAQFLGGLLAEAGDARRVKPGQVWHVCVQGMKETPLHEPIDEYIIPGTKACSDDFVLP